MPGKLRRKNKKEVVTKSLRETQNRRISEAPGIIPKGSRTRWVFESGMKESTFRQFEQFSWRMEREQSG